MPDLFKSVSLKLGQRYKLLLVTFAVVLYAVPFLFFRGFSHGAVFAKYDGIDGESTDAEHKEWINILSYGFGITRQTASDGSSLGLRISTTATETMSPSSITSPSSTRWTRKAYSEPGIGCHAASAVAVTVRKSAFSARRSRSTASSARCCSGKARANSPRSTTKRLTDASPPAPSTNSRSASIPGPIGTTSLAEPATVLALTSAVAHAVFGDFLFSRGHSQFFNFNDSG